MSHLKEQYAELIGMAKLHLLQEYSPQQLVSATSEGHAFFQKYLIAPPVQTKSTPVAKTAPSPKAAPPTQTISTPVPQQQKKELASPPSPPSAPAVAPTPASHKPETPSASNKTSLFSLNPLGAPPSADFKEIQHLIGNHLTGYTTTTSIPSDQAARQINMAWKQGKRTPSVILLSFNEGEKERLFLYNVAQAISLSIAPAEVISAQRIEQNNKWDAMIKSEGLRLVIASDYAIHTMPGLMKHFKEQQKQGKHFLGSIPFLLLSDLSLYMKEPKLKPLLWRAICAEFVK